MQIVRDTRINKTTDNKGNLYDDPLMALVGLVEMFGKYINYNTRMKGTNANSAMSMPMVMKRIAGKIGSVGRSSVEIENDYKMFKQATRTMILLVYVGSI